MIEASHLPSMILGSGLAGVTGTHLICPQAQPGSWHGAGSIAHGWLEYIALLWTVRNFE